jgi:hypothetical protein
MSRVKDNLTNFLNNNWEDEDEWGFKKDEWDLQEDDSYNL